MSLMDRTILITNGLGDAADPAPVVTYLTSLAAKKTPGGCSTRWAIAATPSTFPTSLQVEFQSLSAPAKSLNKSNLKADNCVNIQVARIPLKVELFNGDLAAGPVPILFFSDRAGDFKGLMEHADTVLEDLGKLNSRFYFMEHLSME